ncbi:MAG: hypothetical protein HZB34_13545 [Nitrospirae bacterium]|nr:hypothetical protein [Nitrospirota bacterium]
MKPSRRLVWLLWMLLFAFCCRVLGQALVAFLHVTWLPPMEEWYSGLMAYPLLLPTQLLIIAIFTKVCWDFTRGHGYFVQAKPLFGRTVLWFGYAYLAGMVLRYIIHMNLNPEARWFGGTIPILFHWVLAAFIIAFGQYHRGRRTQSSRPS